MNQRQPTLEGLVLAQQYRIQLLEEKLRPFEEIQAYLKNRCFVCHCCNTFGFILESSYQFSCGTCLKTYLRCEECQNFNSTACSLTPEQHERIHNYWRDIVDFTPFICSFCNGHYYHKTHISAAECSVCRKLYPTCSNCLGENPRCKDCI